MLETISNRPHHTYNFANKLERSRKREEVDHLAWQRNIADLGQDTKLDNIEFLWRSVSALEDNVTALQQYPTFKKSKKAELAKLTNDIRKARAFLSPQRIRRLVISLSTHKLGESFKNLPIDIKLEQIFLKIKNAYQKAKEQYPLANIIITGHELLLSAGVYPIDAISKEKYEFFKTKLKTWLAEHDDAMLILPINIAEECKYGDIKTEVSSNFEICCEMNSCNEWYSSIEKTAKSFNDDDTVYRMQSRVLAISKDSTHEQSKVAPFSGDSNLSTVDGEKIAAEANTLFDPGPGENHTVKFKDTNFRIVQCLEFDVELAEKKGDEIEELVLLSASIDIRNKFLPDIEKLQRVIQADSDLGTITHLSSEHRDQLQCIHYNGLGLEEKPTIIKPHGLFVSESTEEKKPQPTKEMAIALFTVRAITAFLRKTYQYLTEINKHRDGSINKNLVIREYARTSRENLIDLIEKTLAILIILFHEKSHELATLKETRPEALIELREIFSLGSWEALHQSTLKSFRGYKALPIDKITERFDFIIKHLNHLLIGLDKPNSTEILEEAKSDAKQAKLTDITEKKKKQYKKTYPRESRSHKIIRKPAKSAPAAKKHRKKSTVKPETILNKWIRLLSKDSTSRSPEEIDSALSTLKHELRNTKDDIREKNIFELNKEIFRKLIQQLKSCWEKPQLLPTSIISLIHIFKNLKKITEGQPTKIIFIGACMGVLREIKEPMITTEKILKSLTVSTTDKKDATKTFTFFKPTDDSFTKNLHAITQYLRSNQKTLHDNKFFEDKKDLLEWLIKKINENIIEPSKLTSDQQQTFENFFLETYIILNGVRKAKLEKTEMEDALKFTSTDCQEAYASIQSKLTLLADTEELKPTSLTA